MASERYRDFVAATFAKRIPAILGAVEAAAVPEAARRIAAIARAVEADEPMALDLAGWPYPGWEDLPHRVDGRRPREAPFFDFEFWMYFSILDAVQFAETSFDPFRPTKHRDLDRHLAWADAALARTTDLARALRLALEANIHDLSQLAGPAEAHEIGTALLDLPRPGLRRLNLVADNFGAEFMGDLVLAVVAADFGIEAVVHVKQLPIFVSDATMDDVTILLDRLNAASPFGRRLLRCVERGTVRFVTDPFWAAPQYFDRLPRGLLGEGAGILNVVKGDLNFRRMIGDVTVPIETAFADLAVLPSVPMLSLRAIKSYCVAGITDWPAGLSREAFPTDGSIAAVQRVPARPGAAASPDPQSPPA